MKLGDYFTEAMGQAEACPALDCANTQPPDAAIPRAIGWHLHYACEDCGHTWTSNWNEESN